MAAPCLQTHDRRPRTRQAGARPPGTSVREAPFTLVRDVAADGQPDDGLTLDGYGAVFNRLTLIDSWEGRFREQIANGSMKKSFRETPPKIQFDHGRHPLIGSLPVASLVSVVEDSHPDLAPDGGAHIIGRLLDNWLVQPVRDAIAAGAVDGMSFRFEVVDERWAYADGKPIRTEADLMAELDRCYFGDVAEDDLPIRTLKQLRVPEMGPVTWPAYADTSVSVRSKVIDLGKLHRPENRALLARAVFMADAIEGKPETQRAQDTPDQQDDADEDPMALVASLDAVLDEASDLVTGIDLSGLPPEVAQAISMLIGAETIADQLMEVMGVYDPDDDESGEDSGRSGQQPTDTAGKHPTREQRATQDDDGAGEHSTRQRATGDTAGEHQSNPRGTRPIDLWVNKSRDVLLSIEARKGTQP